MSDNYEDILSRSWDDIPEPKPLPNGSYLLKGRNASYQPAKDDTKSPQVLFVYQPKEPMDDVDSDELAALGADYSIENNKVFHRIYINDDTSWDDVRKHLEKHGVDLGKGLGEGLKNFKGSEVIAYLEQNQYTNAAGETVTDNRPKQFAKVE